MNNQTKAHIIKLLDKGSRLDGRKNTEYRQPIKVEYNVSKSAEGSAKVTIGETVVIAGVKMEVNKPYPDTPDKGSLMVGAELYPMSSPNFESGPPSIQAIELSRVIDRGIRESGAIDLNKLCIKEGELMWIAVIDICTLNETGNLFDAGALAAMAALKVTKMPTLVEDKVDYKKLTDEALPLHHEPLSVTVHKIGKHFLIDPTTEEEEASDARLTVASTEDGQLCAMQKGGDTPLSAEDIDKMVGIALEAVAELRKALG